MNKTRITIVGYGNIGKYVLETVLATPDMELSGVARRNTGGPVPKELAGIRMVQDVSELGSVDIALLCISTRSAQEYAQTFPAMGVHTVSSFDIRTSIPELRVVLDRKAKESGWVTVLSTGQGPDSDSVVHALVQVCAPKGITYTSFGPGMSMGYMIVAGAIKGVEGALSTTIPLGMDVHRRMVYVQLEDDADLAQAATAIRNDDCFAHNEIRVIQVPDISAVIDKGHGVRMERKDTSDEADNQRSKSRMEINNPTLTSQITVACARAAMRQQLGTYTVIETPVVDLLPDSCESTIVALV